MSGCAEMDSLEEEVPEDGAEAGWAGRKAGKGWEHKTATKARRVDMLGSCSGAQPHLSLPNDHITVFPLLQDLEKHVAFQLVKHLWQRTADRLGLSPVPLPGLWPEF